MFPANDLTLRTIQQRRRDPKSNYGILLVIYTYLGPKGFNMINALKLSLVIHSFLGMRIKYYSNYNKQEVWGGGRCTILCSQSPESSLETTHSAFLYPKQEIE